MQCLSAPVNWQVEVLLRRRRMFAAPETVCEASPTEDVPLLFVMCDLPIIFILCVIIWIGAKLTSEVRICLYFTDL